MRMRLDRRLLVRFALPVLGVGAAHLLTQALWGVMEGNLSLLFITAVMVSALYGGLTSGLIAGVVGALACAYFYLPPTYYLRIGADDLFRLAAFVFVAVFVSWLSGSRRRWEEALREEQAVLERRVLERTAALRVVNEELEDEVAERRKAEARILAYQGRLRSLAAELSIAEERQRRQIAAALHDAVGHRLAVAVMNLRGLLADGGHDRPPQVAKACELVEQAIGHTRSLTLQLSPPVLYELGLEAALEWLAEQVQRETALSVTVTCDDAGIAADNLTRGLLFNAVRELLVNVVKHADATSAAVSLASDGDHVRVTVADDGVGCDAAGALTSAVASGFGLFNIRERLTHLGGRLEVASNLGEGCRVTLVAPLNAGAEPAPNPRPGPSPLPARETA